MLDKAGYLAMLKLLYTSDRVLHNFLEHSAFLAAVKKSKCGGDTINQPIIYGAVQNRSASYAKSSAGTDSSNQEKFVYDIAKNFQQATIDHVLLKRSENNSVSFKNAVTHEIECAIAALKRDISLNMFLKSDGAIGKVGAIAGNVITLSVPSDIVRFELGMVLKPDAVAGGVAEAKATMKVVARDDADGKITVDAIGAAEVADFLHVDGDQSSKMQGLSDWLPFGTSRDAQLAAAFNGITRSKDPTRLAGVYINGSTGGIAPALRKAKACCQLYGIGEPEVVIMHPIDMYLLENEMEGLAIADKMNVKVGSITIGFDSIRLGSVGGGARIVSDGACPRGVAFLLKMSTWTYWHLGKSFLNTWNEDGLDMIRHNSENALTAKMYSYGNLGCGAPAANAVIWLGIRDAGL